MAHDRVKAHLDQFYGPVLLPGASDTLASAWGHLEGYPRPVLARRIAEGMGTELGKRHVDPEKAGAVPVAVPLRRVLERFSAELKPGGADELYNKLQSRLGHLDEPVIMERVAMELEKRENAGALLNPPPVSAREQHATLLINTHFPELSSEAAARMAGDYRPVQGQTDTQYVRSIAMALAAPPVAAKYTVSGQPIARDDPRGSYRPDHPSETAAGEPGQSVQPSATSRL